MPPSDYRLRRAIAEDAPAIATVFSRSCRANLPYLPVLHTDEGDREYFTSVVMAECIVWVAETDRIVGFIAWRDGWVDHLYLDVGASGRGIGSALLNKALADQPRLQLWAFQKNVRAIRFYRRNDHMVKGRSEGRGHQADQAIRRSGDQAMGPIVGIRAHRAIRGLGGSGHQGIRAAAG